MRKKVTLGVLVVIAVALVAFLRSDVHRIYLPTATGIMAKQVCSLHFVSGLAPERARALYLDPLVGTAGGAIVVTVDAPGREVRSSIFGLYGQRAVFREGLGCSLVHDGARFDRDLALPVGETPRPMALDTTHRAAHFDGARLRAAIDAAFDEPAGGGRNTLAVVVLHQGRLVAERYAPEVTATTPLHGWSMAKSVTAALAGALVLENTVDLQALGAVPNPAHHDITLDHLLRMTAGLDLVENQSGMDPNSDMLFSQGDMAAWASARERLHAPGERFLYMSGATVLAARRLQDALGPTLADQVEGLRGRLFRPLEMHSAIMEVDEAGTFQGSSYVYASAQDWARLGQLFLDDGVHAGRRLLAEGWVETVRRRTPQSNDNERYGLGFWLLDGYDTFPDGGYFMNGFQGQHAFILPAQDLVVVRLGATGWTDSGGFGLARAVIGAMGSDGEGATNRAAESGPSTPR